MIYYLFALVIMIYAGCGPKESRTEGPIEISAEAISSTLATSSADSVYSATAFQAIDRQCGSCHHGNRSTNTGALAIFNLQDACWYCKLSPEQAESLTGRVSGSSFSEEERNAIVALLDELREEKSQR